MGQLAKRLKKKNTTQQIDNLNKSNAKKKKKNAIQEKVNNTILIGNIITNQTQKTKSSTKSSKYSRKAKIIKGK